jgi:uncharacterized protein
MNMTLKKLLNIFLAGIFFLLWASYASALDVPALKGRVNDYGDMLSPSTERQLDAVLGELERTDSTQIVVLTIKSLKGDSLEDFSIRVADKWKIGQKGKDNGAILLVSKNDRKIRIESGYGLEGSLTDLTSGRIIRNVIAPYFKRGDFDGGISNGVYAMIQAVRGEYKGDAKPVRSRGRRASGSSLVPILLMLFIINRMGRVKRPLGGILGGILFPIIGLMLFGPGLIMLLFIPFGIAGGLLLSLFGGPLTTGSSHSSRHSGGFWMGGGGIGGGGFGGGGFGGFSGGGGGFGGGGASGGW